MAKMIFLILFSTVFGAITALAWYFTSAIIGVGFAVGGIIVSLLWVLIVLCILSTIEPADDISNKLGGFDWMATNALILSGYSIGTSIKIPAGGYICAIVLYLLFTILNWIVIVTKKSVRTSFLSSEGLSITINILAIVLFFFLFPKISPQFIKSLQGKELVNYILYCVSYFAWSGVYVAITSPLVSMASNRMK
jgi:hypothetical protein